MAELVGVAVLFYVLGLLTKVAWISDRIAPARDWDGLELEKPSDIEKRARGLL
jgi:hypothetical protein